jgi:hypothetical protein
MFKGIQLVGMLIGLYLFWSTYINYKKEKVGIQKTVFWASIWLMMSILFVNTNLMSLFLPILTTQDGIQTVIVLGILTSFVFINQVYQKVIDLDNKITILSQNLALNDYFRKATEDR